jgi:hypothetical protein
MRSVLYDIQRSLNEGQMVVAWRAKDTDSVYIGIEPWGERITLEI